MPSSSGVASRPRRPRRALSPGRETLRRRNQHRAAADPARCRSDAGSPGRAGSSPAPAPQPDPPRARPRLLLAVPPSLESSRANLLSTLGESFRDRVLVRGPMSIERASTTRSTGHARQRPVAARTSLNSTQPIERKGRALCLDRGHDQPDFHALSPMRQSRGACQHASPSATTARVSAPGRRNTSCVVGRAVSHDRARQEEET